MKTMMILNALPINEYAFKKINEKSSVECACEKSFSICDRVAVLVDTQTHFVFPNNVQIIRLEKFDAKTVFAQIAETAKDVDAVFIASCDAPFLDKGIAEKLLQIHEKYKAEYSFAEGFPNGLAPELIDTGLVHILSGIANLENVKNNRGFVFETLKQNINSYDIETIIAPADVQTLRLDFFANSKRSLALCRAFTDIDCENYARVIAENEKKLFTLPAYYAIEVSQSRSVHKIYLPKKKSNAPKNFLSIENFKTIIDKIAAYSDDAVVSLSIFGEPFLNENVTEMIAYCLQQKNISVLLETSAVDFGEEKILEIKKLSEKYSKTPNGKIFWIVCLDAASKEKYAEVSELDAAQAEKFFTKATENIFTLQKNFGKDVYPQFVRMNENENELETFYRYWKEKINCVLVQKYDDLAGQIPNRRVADISPLERNVCWHLKRDMYIDTDGTVLLCKEDAMKKKSFGNILTDDIEAIRKNIFEIYTEHVNKNYKGLCENCDEYYTYNF